jgi:hypothetical protein
MNDENIVKIRSQQITIDLPVEDALPWVRATLQRCIKDADYKTVQTIDRVGFVHRSAEQFAMQMTTVVDPLTGQQHTLSGVAVAILIRDMVSAWIVEDRGGVINEYQDIIEG